MSKPLFRFKLSKPAACTVAALSVFTAYAQAADTAFSTLPLAGVSKDYGPNVALALSVEFPTAGAAYPSGNRFYFEDLGGGYTARVYYRGYFDNTKCYQYVSTTVYTSQAEIMTKPDDGYFVPSSIAQTDAQGRVGLCNNGGDKEEFSGNMLNYLTMSAVDVFRSALSGGNRAFGTGTDAAAYQAGDTPSATYLRRANVVRNQNGITFRERQIHNPYRASLNSVRGKLLARFLPEGYIRYVIADSAAGIDKYGSGVNAQGMPNPPADPYSPKAMGMFAIETSTSSALFAKRNGMVGYRRGAYNPYQRLYYTATTTRNLGQTALANDAYYLADFFVINDGFTMQFARKLEFYDEDGYSTNRWNKSSVNLSGVLRDYEGANGWYWAVPNNGQSDWYKWARRMNVVVKVCDPANPTGMEANCKPYGTNYKPEGLLQEYAEKNMRVAALGYLNISGNNIDGGVLRSRMKQLNKTETANGVVYGSEWNEATGQFAVNPDSTDANSSGVSNSGTINYLNKFGDASGYKTNDPSSELYYTALAYLRGLHNVGSSNPPYRVSPATLTAEAKDGFPVIYNWDDPMKRGLEPSTYQCHSNSIIFIGDTNTHQDSNVPNFIDVNQNPYSRFGGQAADLGLNARAYASRLFDIDSIIFYGSSGSRLTAWGASGGNGTPAMAAVAYWARVNDIRPDITGIQNGNNFIIDVLENGDYKNGWPASISEVDRVSSPIRNAYYLAAKFGGFTRLDTRNDTNTDVNTKEAPTERSQWTDDAVDTTSSAGFPQGVPRNYAIANDPDNMISALQKAFLSTAAAENPTQTAISFGTGSQTVDFSNGKSATVLQTTFNVKALSGDVIASSTLFDVNSPNSALQPTRLWSAASNLNAAYHSTVTYTNRKVYTYKNGRTYDVNAANANTIMDGIALDTSANASDLLAYVLGNSSKEGMTLRKRASLLGSVVNSTVLPLPAPTNNPKGCTFADTNYKQRPAHYAFAANDGMLHILDANGNEKLAYLSRAALPKLPEVSKINAKHQYLNDGAPVSADICVANEAKSVVVGTTGRGGAGVYALDVTDLSTPSADNIIWEFTSADDADLGLTVAQPIITRTANGIPVAIVSSGYNNASGKGYLFVLDLTKTGNWALNQNYWKIPLGDSGVGEPFAYDANNDGAVDKVFVGDLSGKLWQVETAGEIATWQTAYNNQPLFTPTAGQDKPITGKPYAQNIRGKLYVVAATGKYFDNADTSATQQNYAYGFVANGTTPLTNDDLVQQQINANNPVGLNNDRTLYTITNNEANGKGWRLTLLPGQLVAAESLIRNKKIAQFVAVRSVIDSSNACVLSGTTSIISVDVMNGGEYNHPIYDTNGDGVIDDRDIMGGVLEYANVFNPQASTTSVIYPDGTKGTLFGLDAGNGDIKTEQLYTPINDGMRRLSWSELF